MTVTLLGKQSALSPGEILRLKSARTWSAQEWEDLTRQLCELGFNSDAAVDLVSNALRQEIN